MKALLRAVLFSFFLFFAGWVSIRTAQAQDVGGAVNPVITTESMCSRQWSFGQILNTGCTLTLTMEMNGHRWDQVDQGKIWFRNIHGTEYRLRDMWSEIEPGKMIWTQWVGELFSEMWISSTATILWDPSMPYKLNEGQNGLVLAEKVTQMTFDVSAKMAKQDEKEQTWLVDLTAGPDWAIDNFNHPSPLDLQLNGTLCPWQQNFVGVASSQTFTVTVPQDPMVQSNCFGNMENNWSLRHPSDGSIVASGVYTTPLVVNDLSIEVYPREITGYVGDWVTLNITVSQNGPDMMVDSYTTVPVPFMEEGLMWDYEGYFVRVYSGVDAELKVVGTHILTATIKEIRAQDPNPANNTATYTVTVLPAPAPACAKDCFLVFAPVMIATRDS